MATTTKSTGPASFRPLASKHKSWMMREWDVFRIRLQNTLVRRDQNHHPFFNSFLFLTTLLFLGACSALFLHKLASDSALTSSTHVTLEDVKQASTKHEFLKGILDDVTETSAPKLPTKKKPKLDATVKEAIVVSNVMMSRLQPEITVDEDDYD